MQIPKEVMPLIGPVLGAMIAGVVAFLASVLTKESKVSEFRQAWIDGLRDDISEFVSAFYWISDTFRQHGIETPSLKGEFLKVERMQARIELRLNPKEHAELLRRLHGLVRFETFDPNDGASRNAAVNAFIAESQKVLKDAWIDVKRGEWTYRFTKWFSLLFVIAAVTFAIFVVHGTINVLVAP